MVRIYRTTDKIKYTVGELTVWLSPLSLNDKAELHTFLEKAQKGDVLATIQAAAFAIKCSLKEVKGLTNQDGSSYSLEFDNGKLSDSCVDDLMNIQESNKLIVLCSQLIAGIPKTLPEGITLQEKEESSDPL